MNVDIGLSVQELDSASSSAGARRIRYCTPMYLAVACALIRSRLASDYSMTRRWLRQLALLASTFTLVFVATRLLRPRPATSLVHDRTRRVQQLVVVVVTSPDCSASDARAMGVLLRPFVADLRVRRASDSVEIRTIGVSVDRDPERAFAHLREFLEFDEYAVGGDWANVSAQRFAVGTLAGPLMVPQVVLTSRWIDPAPSHLVGPDSLIARLLGVEGLRRWVRRHADPDAKTL